MGGIPEIPKNRIFFFNGEDGYTPETTSEELSQFVRQCLRTSMQASDFNHFDIDSYMANQRQREVQEMSSLLDVQEGK